MQYDFVIIGSGITGLTAALYLRKHGKRVIVLEKASRVAPTLAGFRRRGLHFDTGLHLSGGLGEGESLHTYLNLLGIDKKVERVPLHAHAAEQLLFEDGSPPLMMPRGRDALQKAITARFPAEQAGIAAYFTETKQAVDSSPFLNPRLLSDESLSKFLSETTLEEKLNKLIQDPVLRLVFSLHCGLHGSLPGDVSFHSHALVDGSMHESLSTIRGGGQALVRALATAFTRQGGTLRASCPAVRIVTKNGAVQGVTTGEGETISASQCIYTGHPSLLPELVDPGALRLVYCKRLTSLPETTSSCMLFARLDGAGEELQDLEGRCIYLCPQRPMEELFDGKNPDHNLIFFSIPPREAPNKPLTLTAVMPCDKELFARWQQSTRGHRPLGYIETKRRLLRIMEQRIITALPFLAGSLRVVEGSTPLTLADYTHNPRGGTYGVMHTVESIPLLPRTKISGLALAGQSILLPGILGCMVSAFVACRLFIDPVVVHKELRQWHENALS